MAVWGRLGTPRARFQAKITDFSVKKIQALVGGPQWTRPPHTRTAHAKHVERGAPFEWFPAYNSAKTRNCELWPRNRVATDFACHGVLSMASRNGPSEDFTAHSTVQLQWHLQKKRSPAYYHTRRSGHLSNVTRSKDPTFKNRIRTVRLHAHTTLAPAPSRATSTSTTSNKKISPNCIATFVDLYCIHSVASY